MGQELRFYLAAADEGGLAKLLREKHGLAFARAICLTESERLVEDFASLGSYPTDNQLVLVHREQVAAFVPIVYPEGHVRIDIARSNAIEFKRSLVDGKKLRPGRIWYEKKADSQKKPKEFLSLAAAVFRTLSQSLNKIDEPISALAGRQAVGCRESGELEFVSW